MLIIAETPRPLNMIWAKKILFIFALLHLQQAMAGKSQDFIVSTIADFETNPAYQEMKTFVQESLQDCNIKVKYSAYPLHRGTSETDDGNIDAELLMTKNALLKHPNLVATSFPIVITPDKIISLKRNKKFNELDLKSFRGITMLNASATLARAKELKLNLLEINSVERQIDMLISGRADYLISPVELVISNLKNKPKLMDRLAISKTNFLTTPYYFLINKKHLPLLPSIESCLKKSIQGDLSKYKFIQRSLNTKLATTP